MSETDTTPAAESGAAAMPRTTYVRHCAQPSCPGHVMCFACREDVCTEEHCGGCACPANPCAWAGYEPDCPPWEEGEFGPDTLVEAVVPRPVLWVLPGGIA